MKFTVYGDDRLKGYFLLIRFLLLLLPAGWSLNASAQKYNFTQYDIEQGIVQSQIMSIYQDPSRYLWFGTRGGVCRFDGKEFISYTKSDGLDNNMVTSILTDHKGIVWVGHENGISRIEGKNITNISIPVNEGSGLVRALLEDRQGRIWLTSKSRLFKLVQGKIVAAPITDPEEYVTSLVQNRSGVLYAAVWQKGIFYFNGKKWVNVAEISDGQITVLHIVFDHKDPARLYLLSPNGILEFSGRRIKRYANKMLDTIQESFFALEQDAQGNLWLGTNNGVYWLREKDPVHFTAENGFKNISVNDIFRDSEDNIWLGSDGTGVFRFEGDSFTSFHKFNGLEEMIMPIARDTANVLWLGTTNNGLMLYDGQTFKNVYLPSPAPYLKSITSLYNDPHLGMLVGTLDGLWRYDGKRFSNLLAAFPFPRTVRSVIADRSGTIWMAAPRGCFYLEKGKMFAVQGLAHSPNMLKEIGKDSILVATNQGLALVKNKVVDPSFRIPALSNTTVFSILRYQNVILAATFGDGLFVIDIATRSVKKYGLKQGFYSNDIYSVAVDRYGSFWAGTGRGVNRFTIDLRTLSVTVAGDLAKNALIECNQNSILNFDDKIWVGSTKGLFAYHTGAIDLARKKPFINIQSVKIMNQAAATGNEELHIYADKIPKELRFDHHNNRILISFRGIYFTNPEDVSYQYRLKGLDETFSQPIKTNMIEYPSLLPGTYTFEVKAVTSTGAVSNTRSITFIITPPFYQTLLFRVFVLMLLILFIISIQYYWTYRKAMQKRIRRQIKLEEQLRIRRQTAEDFHDDIGNKLTRIAVLSDILTKQIGDAKPEQKEIINQIKSNAATLYSGTKDILWALDPQSDNLYEIMNYIHDFGTGLFHNTDISFTFDAIDPKFEKLPLPMEYSRNITLIVKESLNNVLKHAGATEVALTSSAEKDKITIIITDNGKGFDTGISRKGRGLNNIKVRAGRINATVDIASVPGEGTRISLLIALAQP